MTTDQLNVQPFLFFVPALAIFAMGLFFLRIFPWLLKLFNWLGKKFLPVPFYLDADAAVPFVQRLLSAYDFAYFDARAWRI